MPLVNGLPIGMGNKWSATVPTQLIELITTWNIEEASAMAAPPMSDLAWADVGTKSGTGMGIVKSGYAMPSTLDFQTFKPDGARQYHTFSAVVTAVSVSPFELSFRFPMIWNDLGNGYQLMSERNDGTLIDFMGINGMAAYYVLAGRGHKAKMLATLFSTGLYSTALGLTTPTAVTGPMPNNPNGIALFTDGTGAEGTPGAQHYSNPGVASSGRFKNVWPAFGSFTANYGLSLTKMGLKPHPTMTNVTIGGQVTDTFGPPHMRQKFYEMAVQALVMKTETVSGTGVAAGVTNPYSAAAAAGITEENFLGVAFGPRRFWIVPHLEFHPYVVANPTKDMWINVSAGKDMSSGLPRAPWARLVSNQANFIPVFHFYGPGDPRAQTERMMRFEGDLDAGAGAADPAVIDVFFET